MPLFECFVWLISILPIRYRVIRESNVKVFVSIAFDTTEVWHLKNTLDQNWLYLGHSIWNFSLSLHSKLTGQIKPARRTANSWMSVKKSAFSDSLGFSKNIVALVTLFVSIFAEIWLQLLFLNYKIQSFFFIHDTKTSIMLVGSLVHKVHKISFATSRFEGDVEMEQSKSHSRAGRQKCQLYFTFLIGLLLPDGSVAV